jgi:uncharacterized protein YbjT (DUF2867 family)
MILVTGASGTVGREVVAQLLAQKLPVRALTRNAATGTFPAGVDVALGDLERPETLPAALAGVHKVFALSSGPAVGQHDANLARAVKAAGIKRLVKLSANSVTDHPSQLIGQWHLAGEQAIRDAGLAWTFVRPGGFMTNAYNWIATVKAVGKVFAAAGDGKSAPIDPRDIAAVVVRALTTDGHEGQTYTLSGPEALTMAEQVAQLARAIDKPLAYVAVPDAAAREGMRKAGLPTVMIDAILELMGNVRAGEGAVVLPTVEQVLGRKARRFADWAQEHRQAFL